MYIDNQTRSYVLVGTVLGHGYNCNSRDVRKFEGSNNGLWNKVSLWVDWIKGKMEEFGESQCISLTKRNVKRDIES